MAKILFDFDPEEDTGIKLPKDKDRRDEALDKVSEYVTESVLSTVGEGNSPVAGGQWKKSLTKEYKKRKGEVSSVTYANMELNGDLLDSLEVVRLRGAKLRLTVGADQMDKADGHNNFSGKSKLPAREFIPNAKKGQTFKRDIQRGIRSILEEYEEDDESKDQ